MNHKYYTGTKSCTSNKHIIENAELLGLKNYVLWPNILWVLTSEFFATEEKRIKQIEKNEVVSLEMWNEYASLQAFLQLPGYSRPTDCV
jgi:hypothetical protein